VRINLISVGKNMPAWVDKGFAEYRKRLPAQLKLQLIEIGLIKRSKNSNIDNIIKTEGEHILAASPKTDYTIALDRSGKQWSTLQLAEQLQYWLDSGQNVSIFIGGPDGLSTSCLENANQCWALSMLTYPHPLVRIIVAEQLYRAWTILHHHPYHR